MKLLRVLWLSFLGLTFVAAQAPTPANCQTVLTIVGVQCAMPCCAKALPMSRKCPMQHLAPAQDIIAAHATFWNDTPNALYVLHTLIVRTPESAPIRIRAVSRSRPWFSFSGTRDPRARAAC